MHSEKKAQDSHCIIRLGEFKFVHGLTALLLSRKREETKNNQVKGVLKVWNMSQNGGNIQFTLFKKGII